MTTNHQLSTERSMTVTDDKRVEVKIDGETAVIRLFSYADGIGWFVQKTITVDADMLDVLYDQFSTARGKIRREGDDILSAELLEL
ncbi:MAG: hypothetical protein ABIR33_12495 [Pyrinomonadaceae bacterium]